MVIIVGVPIFRMFTVQKKYFSAGGLPMVVRMHQRIPVSFVSSVSEHYTMMIITRK